MSDDSETLNEASAEDAEVPREASEDAAEDFHPFDEIDEEYGGPQPAVYVTGRDGLPTQTDQTEHSDIPVLSKHTLVCMADTSKFVLRNGWGEVFAEFEPHEVEQAPNGVYRVPGRLAFERCGGTRAKIKHVASFVRVALLGRSPLSAALAEWVEVEPVRPQCKHYVRQKTQFELNPQAKFYARLCAARRTTEGTFMTLKDTGMWACSMRDPVDLESEEALDKFDEMKEEQGRNRHHLPIVTADDNKDDTAGPGGIFGGANG